MNHPLDFRNTNALWCSVLVETLARCGLSHAVISPGSRSTPLTLALVRDPRIEAVPVLDERSAGFFALGLAKRTHRPVVLVCTSGTAGAHYLPAVIEAHESGTPLLVITADRPPEMRDCASGQTIEQQKLFGGFVSFFHEFAVPEAKVEMLRYARQTMAHAYGRACLPHGGPVHLNMPFRDPLAPIEDGTANALASTISEDFFSHLESPPARVSAIKTWQRPVTTRGLIVAGPANPRDVSRYVAAVRAFAAGTGWPILADALSPLRHHGADDGVSLIAHYDAILRDERTARDLVPRQVICLENWPTSKVLRRWIEESGAESVLVADTPFNRDALHGRARHLAVAVESLVAEGEPANDGSYRAAWSAAESAARAVLAAGLERSGPGFFEPAATWTLAHALAEEATVFVASSMPVRDVEYFWPATARRYRFYFNRGANGIDGTFSTALGVAHGGGTVVLLTGDLAFLHDSSGLLLASKLRGSVTVVLINNNGGGIFEHLPVAAFNPPFEEFFATPQRVDFAKLCAAHGIAHGVVRDVGHLRELVAHPPGGGVRVLEVCTDRKRDAAGRKRLLAAAGAATRA